MAERAGVRAFTINSENRDDWEEITGAIERDEVDLLLGSPERFTTRRVRRSTDAGRPRRTTAPWDRGAPVPMPPAGPGTRG